MASGLCAALTGRTHGCTDQPANVKKTLANSEPSTHGTRASSCSGVVVSFTLAAASRVSKVSRVSRVSRMILATSRSMCFSTLCCTHSSTSLGRAYPLAYFCSAQQYHLDALTLHGGNFPAQRHLQLPDLGLAAFDHLFPSESDGQSESHHAPRRQFPSVEYETSKTSIQSAMEAVSDRCNSGHRLAESRG